jgi:hypothetical protein
MNPPLARAERSGAFRCAFGRLRHSPAKLPRTARIFDETGTQILPEKRFAWYLRHTLISNVNNFGNRDMKTLVGVAALLLGVSTNATFAQGDSGVVGSIGLNIGVNRARAVNGGTSQQKETVNFWSLNGDVSFPVGPNFLVGLDATYRYDDFSSGGDFSDAEDPKSDMTATIRALYRFNPDTRAGVFLNYGEQTPQDGDSADAYDYYLVGIEGQTMLADDILIFGQAAVGDKVSDGQDVDEGFNGGLVLRAGTAYFLNDRTALILDLEYAAARNYIDSSDPGRFFGVAFGAETRLNVAAPLFLNYGVTFNNLSSTDEGEVMEELTFGVGLKYVFGADTPRERWTKGIGYGGPRLPVRASAWTEWAD